MPLPPRIEILPPLRSFEDELSDLEWLVDLMDSRFTIPGTEIRLGLDALLGIVPVLGDGVNTLVSAFVFQRLIKYDLPWHTQARMVGNIFLDFALGALPVVGDLVDIGFKANRANLSLAKMHLAKSRTATGRRLQTNKMAAARQFKSTYRVFPLDPGRHKSRPDEGHVAAAVRATITKAIGRLIQAA